MLPVAHFASRSFCWLLAPGFAEELLEETAWKIYKVDPAHLLLPTGGAGRASEGNN